MNTVFASYMIVAWVVMAVAIFPSFPPRRGVLVILLTGILFLPQLGQGAIELGPVKFTNGNAVCYALLLSCLLYDANRLFGIHLPWADLPALIWCACPAVSVLLNDPPPDGSGAIRDAVSQTVSQTTQYLIPYLIGRVYFSDAEGMRELAAGTVAAGLVYVPFCLYEVRFSPQLHATVYGYAQHSFGQTVRFDGYRPMVFMQHGLAVGFFLGTATLLAAWIRKTEAGSDHWRYWSVWLLGPMLILAKSTGAIALTGVGLALLALARTSFVRVALLALVAVPPAYCVARSIGIWDGASLVQLSADSIDNDRAQSLEFRFEQENQLIGRALVRPAFGWGGWGRNRVANEEGKDISVTDGLWIIFMGTSGIVGLTAFGVMMLLPVIRYAVLLPAGTFASPTNAAATGCAIAVVLWSIDSLLNAMSNPLFLVMAGGLTCFVLPPRTWRGRPARQVS